MSSDSLKHEFGEFDSKKKRWTASPLEIDLDHGKSPSPTPSYFSPFHLKVKQKLIRFDNDESHQYEDDESEIWWHHQLQRHFEGKGRWLSLDQRAEIMRWALTLVIGILCGLVALFVTFATKLLSSWKYSYFNHLIEKEKFNELPFGIAFLFLLLTNLLFAFLSVLTVFIEPSVAGSGIPEVKCYLNGLNIPGLIKFSTMVLKAIGIIFACAAGLPLGKEGPMVHVGAVIAAEISQGTFIFQSSYSTFQDFRNDREKRDFVACGAAAGVSAAFGAPIGGVLFSLEEGASYWSTKLTWRSFFCAMTTVFSLYAFNTANKSFGHSDITAMFSFGEFFSLLGEETNYSFWELFLFIVIGCLGGFLGAFFNYCTQLIQNWRNNRLLINNKKQPILSFFKKLLIVLFITTLMTILSCFLPILYEKCTRMPINMSGWGDQEKGLISQLIPYYCNKESEYNELASLYLTDSDTSIRQLFHFREVGDQRMDHTFSSGVLLLFFLPYITMSCITYGTAIPAGMFVPSLLSGAAFGRMIGHLLHKIDRSHGTFADSGTYALIGAASICTGISRMTISLTVMILEATGDMQYVLPLMLTVLVARLFGNLFTEGIYEMQIHRNKMNYLEEEEELSKISEWHDLLVIDVMTPSPICFSTFNRVGNVYEILKKNKHYCYPVIDENENNILIGTISYKVLCSLLKHKAFTPGINSPIHVNNLRVAPLLNWGTIECVYPHYPKIEEIFLQEKEKDYWLDLGPYMDYSPYLIMETASVRRAYRMFRTLGLKQLCVVNRLHQIVGIVTREDLVVTKRLQSQLTSQKLKKKEVYSISRQEYLNESSQHRPMNHPNHNDHNDHNNNDDDHGYGHHHHDDDEEDHDEHTRLTHTHSPLDVSVIEHNSSTNSLLPEVSLSQMEDAHDHTMGNSFTYSRSDSTEQLLSPSNAAGPFGRPRRFSMNHTIDLRASI